MTELLDTIAVYFVLLAIFLLLLPAMFSWFLSKISDHLASLVIYRFGTNCYLAVASLGIIVHELSHLMMALLFGHRITRFRLLQLPKNDQVGFVQHTANSKNPWQMLGNLLIGTAPIFGNSAAIYFVTICLQPALTHLTLRLNWQFFLWLLLTFSLLLGIGLSKADFHNASQGLVLALILILLLAVATALLKQLSSGTLLTLIGKEAAIFILALLILLFFDLFVKMLVSLLP